MKILIIEDEHSMLSALVEKFTLEGYEVVAADNGETGLAQALSQKPDIILLDIVMPKMDGMTVMKKIRESGEWGKHIPIIILTNLYADDGIMQGVTEDEPAYYLVKANWTIAEIVEKVKERLKA